MFKRQLNGLYASEEAIVERQNIKLCMSMTKNSNEIINN